MEYESQRRNRNGNHRRSSRSRTRSRSRERSREHGYRHRVRDRSYRGGGGGCGNSNSNDNDLYRDIINDDYQEERNYNSRGRGCEDDSRDKYYNDRSKDKMRDDERDYEKNDRNRDRHGSRHRRYNTPDPEQSDPSDDNMSYQHDNKNPSHTIIVLRLHRHITEADIRSALIQQNMLALVRLVRERETGVSRGFAFVEFNTVEEAARWMDLNQGVLNLGDVKGKLQYSYSRPADWYCLRCGIYNFRRREKCFRCYALREESSSMIGEFEGGNEVSNILTKKIMLRNLDALTNEEGVLTAIQQHVPDLASKISKVLVSRDSLTQTSRGICYLNFETLVDSMNLHNALAGMEPPFKIDNREVRISYCIDHENRQIVPKKNLSDPSGGSGSNAITDGSPVGSGQYTLSDVPRLAEYSASLYATNSEEHAHYLNYYTEYYISEINKGQQGNLPSLSQLTEANSGAAVADSAIQRKQKKMNSIETTATAAAQAAAQAAAAVKANLAAQMAQPVVTPKGNDGKVYPTPDVSLYQYDETSGYYYDPTTGLYYDAHSQYYYNNETGAYLYWDQRKSTYVLATPAAAAATVQDVVKETANEAALAASNVSANPNNADDEGRNSKTSANKQDKVKVAKKIVKDMEKWAKQLNQKKDYVAVATPQPILTSKPDIAEPVVPKASNLSSTYADVGFSILEKKERNKLGDLMSPASNSMGSLNPVNKVFSSYGGSDSDDEHSQLSSGTPKAAGTASALGAVAESNEKEYVDFQKLTCLLCKRAFQSLEILQKHLKMSNLHKENLQKYNLNRGGSNDFGEASSSSTLNYRDRAKERRQKYGESDPPPPNRIRECFENEIKSLTSKGGDSQNASIAGSNVGSRLLQKMGWSEGQGLGRQNQGRTNIVEVMVRSGKTGLGVRGGMGPNDDYKTYIKKMMKSRYESV